MTNNLPSKQIEIHLKEYETLRSEIRDYMNRIDRYIGIYLAASFAVSGWLLRPESKITLGQYLTQIDRNPSLTAIILLIPIFNSILLTHIFSFVHAIFAQSKYTTYVIREKLSGIVDNRDILLWDTRESVWDKRIWISMRTIAGGLYSILVSAISIGILGRYSYLLLFKGGWPLFLLHLTSDFIVSVSLASLWRFIQTSRKFHEVAPPKESKTSWLVIRSVGIFVFVLMCLTIIGSRISPTPSGQ